MIVCRTTNKFEELTPGKRELNYSQQEISCRERKNMLRPLMQLKQMD